MERQDLVPQLLGSSLVDRLTLRCDSCGSESTVFFRVEQTAAANAELQALEDTPVSSKMTNEGIATLLLETHTPEGLAIEQHSTDDGDTIVREVGHFDYVIYEYRVEPGTGTIQGPGVEFLVRRVAELEHRCAECITAGPIDIDAARWKWNFKAAKRRLRRSVKENNVQLLELPTALHEVTKRVLEEAPESPPEFDGDALNKRLWEEGAIHKFYDYERRKAERVVVVVSEIPAELRALLAEANETYFHGLFRATHALCRAVLEDVLRRAVRLRVTGVGPIPIDEENLAVLINCLPSELLSSKAKTVADKIRRRGNQALHDAEADFEEDETWHILTCTRKLVELLANRGGLVAVSRSAQDDRL